MSEPSPRVAVVTGAARGIGLGIAERLLGDGMAVALLDLDAPGVKESAERLRALGARVGAVVADVSDPGQVAAALQQVERELGPPTVLVNNAGVTRDAYLFKMKVEDWDLVLQVHLRGAFLMSQATQAYMTQAGWGRIVNISSASALGLRGQANYSAAKAGLQGLTKTLALELGRFGVTVNSVAPGFVMTDMTRATAARLGIPWEEYVPKIEAEIPVRRAGVPADIAHAVSYFASEGAGYVSGQVLYVAGGPTS
ncbi:3-oxoacyl-ACP reductase FabG [Sporichthya sp.]|uniref:3-oxoacyl-ACP reductase FabG n=1 Tax=Sporichthya sp. TaxID=65475 RepID=UPI00183B4267|nr:3-oxoacyl-ACP reductase FabG [Sporichthya sp.]MBA3743124.1 3-oxoacyl-ACP reductase FabG [Sporichthya sp.]